MKVQLLDACGDVIGDRDWSYIPRIGEGVLLDDPPDPFRVRDVVWDSAEGELIVCIRLGLFDPLIDTLRPPPLGQNLVDRGGTSNAAKSHVPTTAYLRAVRQDGNC